VDVIKGMMRQDEALFKHFLCPILTFCGTTKKAELLGENYKYIKISSTFRGMLVNKPNHLK
jgi:hypothetical protein